MHNRPVNLRAVSNPTVEFDSAGWWQVAILDSLHAVLPHLEALENVADVDCLELELLPAWLVLCRSTFRKLLLQGRVRLEQDPAVVVRLLVFVGQSDAAIIQISLVVQDEAVVSFPLQVVLNLDLSLILRLVLHDGEQLLAALPLLARQAGPAAGVPDRVPRRCAFRICHHFLLLASRRRRALFRNYRAFPALAAVLIQTRHGAFHHR